ncbi:MAG: tetratricopeptide repeat protein [Mycobacterium pseudokansasii]|nr:tetratricopeptide repeat protein [Mycobacterium pseudokansasii]
MPVRRGAAWAARAHLLVTAGRPAAAARAYRAAIDLSTDAGVVTYLQRRLAAVVRR